MLLRITVFSDTDILALPTYDVTCRREQKEGPHTGLVLLTSFLGLLN